MQKSCNIYILLLSYSLTEACRTATLSHSPPSRWLHFIRRLGSFFSFHFCITNSIWLPHDRQEKQPRCSICRSKTKSAADPCYFLRGHLHLLGLDHSTELLRDYSELWFVTHYSYARAPLYAKVVLDRKG